jgi:hypothetical protein
VKGLIQDASKHHTHSTAAALCKCRQLQRLWDGPNDEQKKVGFEAACLTLWRFTAEDLKNFCELQSVLRPCLEYVEGMKATMGELVSDDEYRVALGVRIPFQTLCMNLSLRM